MPEVSKGKVYTNQKLKCAYRNCVWHAWTLCTSRNPFCWTSTWLNYYFNELLLDWTVTWLNCYLTARLLDWTNTCLSCYFIEMWLDWTVTLDTPGCITCLHQVNLIVVIHRHHHNQPFNHTFLAYHVIRSASDLMKRPSFCRTAWKLTKCVLDRPPRFSQKKVTEDCTTKNGPWIVLLPTIG